MGGEGHDAQWHRTASHRIIACLPFSPDRQQASKHVRFCPPPASIEQPGPGFHWAAEDPVIALRNVRLEGDRAGDWGHGACWRPNMLLCAGICSPPPAFRPIARGLVIGVGGRGGLDCLVDCFIACLLAGSWMCIGLLCSGSRAAALLAVAEAGFA